jgi:hypothetical protein
MIRLLIFKCMGDHHFLNALNDQFHSKCQNHKDIKITIRANWLLLCFKYGLHKFAEKFLLENKEDWQNLI